MKTTILTYGSRGDVQPFLALAFGLRNAGHSVKLAAPHRFADIVARQGIHFVPLAGDPEVISARLNDADRNPIRMVRSMSAYIFSIADQVSRQAQIACADADMIVHSFLFTTGGHSLARKLGIPDVSVQTFPMFAPTSAFPPVALPDLPSGKLSYLFHWLFTKGFWHGGNLGYRRLRKADPESFDLDLRWPFSQEGSHILTPLLLACSPTVLPRPDDWTSPHIHITGYLFLDGAPAFQAPPVLTDFLAAGRPPVCVTFGSTIHRDAARIYHTVLKALERTGERAIILSGWSDLRTLGSPENILVLQSAPHDWLLPRCRAVIHHGGAGTTAAGLRAGIPNVVIPFASDQPFWAGRVYGLEAGPVPIPIKGLTVERLVEALARLEAVAIRSSAEDVGRKIRAEDGVGTAVRLISAHAAVNR